MLCTKAHWTINRRFVRSVTNRWTLIACNRAWAFSWLTSRSAQSLLTDSFLRFDLNFGNTTIAWNLAVLLDCARHIIFLGAHNHILTTSSIKQSFASNAWVGQQNGLIVKIALKKKHGYWIVGELHHLLATLCYYHYMIHNTKKDSMFTSLDAEDEDATHRFIGLVAFDLELCFS